MPVRKVEVVTKSFGVTMPDRRVSGAIPMGARRNPRSRRYHRQGMAPTAGLLGRCFDDSMFADECYQAPSAPMEFVPASETHLDPVIVAQNQHDAQLRPITELQKPVLYSGIPEVTVVPSDQVWGLFDQTLTYVKMSDIQCHCNTDRHDPSKR